MTLSSSIAIYILLTLILHTTYIKLMQMLLPFTGLPPSMQFLKTLLQNIFPAHLAGHIYHFHIFH